VTHYGIDADDIDRTIDASSAAIKETEASTVTAASLER
jgi:hypothetical protein